MWQSMASRAAYVVALRHFGTTGAERRAARIALGNMRSMRLESCWSRDPRGAVGELLGRVLVLGLGRTAHSPRMRHVAFDRDVEVGLLVRGQ